MVVVYVFGSIFFVVTMWTWERTCRRGFVGGQYSCTNFTLESISCLSALQGWRTVVQDQIQCSLQLHLVCQHKNIIVVVEGRPKPQPLNESCVYAPSSSTSTIPIM